MKTTMTESYEDGLKEYLSDPEEAAEYLKAALEDGSTEVFLMALSDVANARGISESARTNKEKLNQIFSVNGDSELSNLNSILQSMGLKLSIEVEAG